MNEVPKNHAIDCMAQHVKIFHQQDRDGALADFGEPCWRCSHVQSCNHDWLSVMEPLLKKSAVKISVVNAELRK